MRRYSRIGSAGTLRPSMMAVKWFDSSPTSFLNLLLKVLLVLPSKPLHPDFGIERGSDGCINHHVYQRVASANHFILIFPGLRFFFKSFRSLGLLLPRHHAWDRLLYVSGRAGAPHAVFAFQRTKPNKTGDPSTKRAISAQGRTRFPYNPKTCRNHAPCLRRLQHSSCGNFIKFDVFPQRHQQLPRQGHYPRFAVPSTAGPIVCDVPFRQIAVRLKSDP